MSRWLSSLLLALAAVQPSDWTTLARDDFEDGTAGQWQLNPDADWKVERDGGNAVFTGRGHSWAAFVTGRWGDHRFRARVKAIRGGIHLNYRTSGCLRYFVAFDTGRIALSKTYPCGTHTELRKLAEKHDAGKWYDVEIVGIGGNVKVYLDQVLKLEYTDPEPLLYGSVALESLPDSEVQVDDVEISGPPPPTLPGGMSWVKTGGPLGGLGYDVRMRPDNPDAMFVTDTFSGASTSTDGGRAWTSANTGITTRTGFSGDAIPVFCLTFDPQNPDIVWSGTQNARGIFKSIDGGKTWTAKVNGIVERQGISFRGITIDPRDSNTVYAAAEISSFVWAGKALLGREFDLTKGVVYKSIDGGERWQPIWRGDNLARYIWIDPRDTNVLYVSTGIFDREAANSDVARDDPGGVGILKSADGGSTWEVLNQSNGLANLYLGSLFLNPENPDILLAGAGNNAWRQGAGVYLSADGGKTWEQTLNSRGESIGAVEFSISDPRIAYAVGEGRVFRSDDGGRNWKQISPGPVSSRPYGPPGIRAGIGIDIQVDPRDPQRLFINNYGGGNFLSEDGGRNWVVASQGYTGAQLHGIAVASSDHRLVYTIGRSGPFRSRDGGGTWEGIAYGTAANTAEWYSVAVDPANPDNVLISDEFGGALLKSTDGGQRWVRVFRHPQAEGSLNGRHGFKTVAFDPTNPGVVYAGMCRDTRSINEGRIGPSFGVFKSLDGGDSWEEANGPNTAGQNVAALALDPRGGDVVYIGTLRGGVFRSLDGGKTWVQMNIGLGGRDVRALAVDPSDWSVIYAGLEGGGVFKSTDAGARWTPANIGMDPQAAIRSIVIDPTNPQTLYAADFRTGVYRSMNGGKLWAAINTGLRTRAVYALAISADGGTLYAATEGEGVFRLDLKPLDR